jgi:hypothetical protein
MKTGASKLYRKIHHEDEDNDGGENPRNACYNGPMVVWHIAPQAVKPRVCALHSRYLLRDWQSPRLPLHLPYHPCPSPGSTLNRRLISRHLVETLSLTFEDKLEPLYGAPPSNLRRL